MDKSTFQRDISELSASLNEGLEWLQWGSFADRNPGLGKMRICPFCRARRREFSLEKCCNAAHVEGRVVDAPFGKQFMRKLRHKRHGQSRVWKIRALTIRMQKDNSLVLAAAKEMYVQKPEIAAIPSFAEKFWHWLKKREARQARKQQQLARRINFKLV